MDSATKIRPPQISFHVTEELDAEIKEVVNSLPGITIADLGRAAFREKVREIRERQQKGEEIVLTIG
jgi:hypothetical protein